MSVSGSGSHPFVVEETPPFVPDVPWAQCYAKEAASGDGKPTAETKLEYCQMVLNQAQASEYGGDIRPYTAVTLSTGNKQKALTVEIVRNALQLSNVQKGGVLGCTVSEGNHGDVLAEG